MKGGIMISTRAIPNAEPSPAAVFDLEKHSDKADIQGNDNKRRGRAAMNLVRGFDPLVSQYL